MATKRLPTLPFLPNVPATVGPQYASQLNLAINSFYRNLAASVDGLFITATSSAQFPAAQGFKRFAFDGTSLYIDWNTTSWTPLSFTAPTPAASWLTGVMTTTAGGSTVGSFSQSLSKLNLVAGSNITLSAATAAGIATLTIVGASGGGGGAWTGVLSTTAGGGTAGTTFSQALTQLAFYPGSNITMSAATAASAASITISAQQRTGNILWKVDSLQTMLTTELNSLGSGTATGVGTEYDNSSNLYMFADFELNVTFGTGPTANTTVDLYIIPALDGTNYDTGDSTHVPPNGGIGSFMVFNSTSAQKLVLRGVMIPPCKFKLIAVNQTNQSFPASGSTVKMLPYGEQMS